MEDGDLCLLKERKSGRASGQNRLGLINLTMPWKSESRLIEDCARTPTGPVVDFILAGEGRPRELIVHRMSAEVMRLFGAQLLLGRRFEMMTSNS